jgi:hypothetical protein
MAKVPRFTSDGLLPAGDFVLTPAELLDSPLVLGWGDGAAWDGPWRRTLAVNVAVTIGHLWNVGIREIYVDGSFVEDKPHPNDIDGYFVCDRQFLVEGGLESRLQEFDAVWTWDSDRRYRSPGTSKRQLPMWHKYRVELYPHVGQGTGIVDQFGNELEFPSALRQSRSFLPKGIIKIEGAP